MSTPRPLPARETSRSSAGEEVAEYIRRLIFDGYLAAGTRVPQDDIAAEMAVSRIPVREALISLERDGWVTIEPHRGAFVNRLTPRVVRDHFELYGLVFGLVTRLATERGSDAGITALNDAERAVSAASDPDELLRLMGEYNAQLSALADSPRLTAVLRGLHGLVPGNLFARVPATVPIAKQGVSAIVKAIQARDVEKADALCRRTMLQYGEEVGKALHSAEAAG